MRSPGYCATCPKPIFTIEQRTPPDHPLPRFPIQLGELEDSGAEVITFLLADGKTTDISVCSRCAPKIDEPGMMRKAWSEQLELGVRLSQSDLDSFLKRKPYTLEQKAKIDQIHIHQWKNPPIGIVARRKYAQA